MPVSQPFSQPFSQPIKPLTKDAQAEAQITNETTSDALTNVIICCEDRWQVYHRLQELEIDCQCGGFQPLSVNIQTATAVIQLWSVVKRVSQSRQQLVDGLTDSWELPCYRDSPER